MRELPGQPLNEPSCINPITLARGLRIHRGSVDEEKRVYIENRQGLVVLKLYGH